jgi:hypothetical protein
MSVLLHSIDGGWTDDGKRPTADCQQQNEGGASVAGPAALGSVVYRTGACLDLHVLVATRGLVLCPIRWPRDAMDHATSCPLARRLESCISQELEHRNLDERVIPADLLGTYFVPVKLYVATTTLTAVQPLDTGVIDMSFEATIKDQGGLPMLSVVSGKAEADVEAPSVLLEQHLRQNAGVGLQVQVVGSSGIDAAVVDAMFSVPQSNQASKSTIPMGQGNLGVPASLLREAQQLISVERGDPSYSAGQGVRMAYLSVSTITTLGLGDIVPLSTTARVFVTVEALFGVIFAGLFVASIAARAFPTAESRAGRGG